MKLPSISVCGAAVAVLACVAAASLAPAGLSAPELRGPDGETICTQSLIGPRWVKRPQRRSSSYRFAGNRYVVTAQKVPRGCGWAVAVARKLMRVKTGSYGQYYKNASGSTFLPPAAKGWICSGGGSDNYMQGPGMAKSPDGGCYTPYGAAVRWFPYPCLPNQTYEPGSAGLCDILTRRPS